MQTTVGQLMINEVLPEDLQDRDRVLDKKGISALLRDVATKHPEKYREISHRLNQIAWRSSQESGGYSFGLRHMQKSQHAVDSRKQLQQNLDRILGDEGLDDKTREGKIIKLVSAIQQAQQDPIYEEAMAADNPLAYQVLSGSRGNKMNLASLLGSDLLYSDHRDQVIPVPVLRSYAEGLSPAEYWAGTYGARKGVMATKFATQEAGFLSKQLNQVAHRLVVNALDRDGDGELDGIRGMPADTADMDNEGALLAYDVGPYKRNTTLTPKILKELHRKGHERILVRSPIVGGTPEGGVYARDVGVRETGSLPGRGEVVGLAAAQALSEPLSQAQLSAKHSGGVAGEEKSLSGFDYINSLIQVPKKMKGGAAHAEVDGIVSHIVDAPAGGKYVSINGEQHYVADGFDLTVKKGDRIEAGDTISDGIPNPAKVVEHKGVGEGRRYFIDAFQKAMKSAGLKSHRRNVELLSRGLINHVKLREELGNYVPDDIVPYSTLEHLYQPREGFEEANLDKAVGKYLERPIMHHTIGTKVRPSMLKDLKHFGVQNLTVHKDPPPFQAEMVRGMYSLQHDPDWMTRMYGSGLKGSVLKATHRGQGSNERGTSFVPGMAQAVDFGREGLIQPPEPFKAAEEKQAIFGSLSWGKGQAATPTPRAVKTTPTPTSNPIKPVNPSPGSGNVPNANTSPPVNTKPPASTPPPKTIPVSTKTPPPVQPTHPTNNTQINLNTPPTVQQPPPQPRYYNQSDPLRRSLSRMDPFMGQIRQGVMTMAPQLGPLGSMLALASLDPAAMMGLLRGPGGQPSLPVPRNPTPPARETAGGLSAPPSPPAADPPPPTNTPQPQPQPLPQPQPQPQPQPAPPTDQQAPPTNQQAPPLAPGQLTPPPNPQWPEEQVDAADGYLKIGSELYTQRRLTAQQGAYVASGLAALPRNNEIDARVQHVLREYGRGKMPYAAVEALFNHWAGQIRAIQSQ